MTDNRGRPTRQLQILICSRCPCIHLFSLCLFFHQPLGLCANYPVCGRSLLHRQMSDTVTFYSFPACCVAQWSVTRFLTLVGPFCRRQASPLIFAHNSLCGRSSQSGATAGLSHSCSGFDLLPFTSDLSHWLAAS